nr:AIF_HP1_G0030840.mRNA.1.CDS.1 [Saccharomyces cerevisiae]
MSERFSYYGLSAPFQRQGTEYKPNDSPNFSGATGLSYFFQFWCYVTPALRRPNSRRPTGVKKRQSEEGQRATWPVCAKNLHHRKSSPDAVTDTVGKMMAPPQLLFPTAAIILQTVVTVETTGIIKANLSGLYVPFWMAIAFPKRKPSIN